MTQEWVAPQGDDPALEALAEGLEPARELGLDVEPAAAILRSATGQLNGRREQALQEARIALTSLAEAAGLQPGGVRELIPDSARRRGVDGAIAEIAVALDMDTFEREALVLVWARAGARGLGPVRWIVAAFGGRLAIASPPPDPELHLRSWKTPGVLERAADRVRQAVDGALPSMPAVLRARYAAAARTDLADRLGTGIDTVIHESAAEAGSPPTNPNWRFVGILQWLNFVIFLAAMVSAIGSGDILPVWRISLRLAADVPAGPFMVALCLLVAFGLTLWLRINATRWGLMWASRIENDVRRGLRIVVEREAFAAVAAIESARARLGEAWHRILA